MKKKVFNNRKDFINEVKQAMEFLGMCIHIVNTIEYQLPEGEKDNGFEASSHSTLDISSDQLIDVATNLADIIGKDAEHSVLEKYIERKAE